MSHRLSRRAFVGGLAASAALASVQRTGSAPLDIDFAELLNRVGEGMQRYNVPGAAIGVAAGGREWTAGLGVTNVEAPYPLSEDTLLPAGPLTPALTATAIIRLVEQGRLQLETPIRAWIPDFRAGTESTARQVTLLDCLIHRTGWWGDDYTDTGSSDDALARYVAGMGELPQTAPYGLFWSYNVAAYCVAGRVIEVVTGRPFEEAIRALVFAPLRMDRSFFNVVEVMSQPISIGHGESAPRVIRPFGAPRGLNPALGALLSLRDILRFLRFHLGDGAPSMLLPLLAYMRAPRTEAGSAAWLALDGIGIGWLLWSAQRQRFAGAVGSTPDGQQLFVLLHPERDFALAIFGNSSSAHALIQELTTWMMSRVLNIPENPPAFFDLAPDLLEPYLGRYVFENTTSRALLPLRYEVALEDGVLTLRDGAGTPARLRFTGRDTVIAVDGPLAGLRADFLRDRQGGISWLRFGLRAVPKAQS
ncbi:MAG: serine hydrolase domain-containing protein [Chloroflexota bacterium]|nr:beta-lactamase family protein [Dehalococcoidia bacterium]MDW8254789.1 serine hydrolase domain-containing protein [Chloroflexota bacterium]